MLIINVCITNFVGPFIMKGIGPAWSFFFWGCCGILGLIYIVCFTKDTTYKIENGKKVLLSQAEKYELYMPEEYRASL